MREVCTSNFSDIEYVFLDRDGVINRNPPEGGFVTSWKQFVLLPGVVEAIAVLRQSGRKVMVVTNQRGVALGLFSEPELRQLHDRLQTYLGSQGTALDAVYCCIHDEGQCACRKPLPGLFEQAFRDFPGANADNSVVIGDSLSDIEAGTRLGMRTIFIADASRSSVPNADRAIALASACATSLLDAVRRYLE